MREAVSVGSATVVSPPIATYRLQLRGGMTFARAAELAPYFAALGISHLYLSPIFTAVPGSTHGYDGIDFNEIDPELGGYEGFVGLSGAMRRQGIGILLDIVPNHMGASTRNPWWRDALEWGAASAFAGHFDVDWLAPKLIVPLLGNHYGAVLKSGALQLHLDSRAGELSITYGDLRLPLNPPTSSMVLSETGEDHLGALALRFAASAPGGVNELKAELVAALADARVAAAVGEAARSISSDWRALHRLHEKQVWRLAHWRTARENLTYRRFFEIAELVGVRVEQPNVFDDVHRTVLELVRDGLVEGLRIDHVDGLADPLGYLTRLRSAVGEKVYVVVEKILGADEQLRANWPVAGTTGYEFMNDLSRLLVDEERREELTLAYTTFIGEESNLPAAILDTKRRTITRNLAGELDYLTQLAANLAAGDIATRDIGADTLRRAIVELASCIPVYRTYVDASGASAEDLKILQAAAAAARQNREVEDDAAFNFLIQLFSLDVGSPDRRAAALTFATRFQQTSGPLTAKALEDTLFYRYNRLIAVNEVGGGPESRGASVDAFHASMQKRLESAPLALSTTATHDTKRGEDARARIYAITEAPEVWADAVARWSAMNAPYRSGGTPDPDFEWMFYQSLLGAWPADLGPEDRAGLAGLSQRMTGFMRKAAREAKVHTTWTQPVEAFEKALDAFVTGTLQSTTFLDDFSAAARPFISAGASNSLAQLCLKLFAPGIPDFYQGAELWDCALVDPDNRRRVDFVWRQSMMEAVTTFADPVEAWMSGSVKLAVMRAGLALRKDLGANVVSGAYVPIGVEGQLRRHVVAFARACGGRKAVIVGTRCSHSLCAGLRPLGAERWRQTQIRLPADWPVQWNDVIAHRQVVSEAGVIDLSGVLRDLPVALLSS